MREHLLTTILLGLGAVTAGCHPNIGGGSGDAGLQQCGATSCGEGTVCCNASCGICTPPGRVCIQIACDPSSVGETCADISCSAGEACADTPSGAQCVAQEENPCNLADCPPSATCQVVQGAASCVPVAVAPVDAGEPMTDAGPTKSDAGPTIGSCAAALCPVDTYCDDITGMAKCIKLPSCDGTSCEVGQHCELQAVQCIRAPCPPQPRCVADAKDPCASEPCEAGTHCEAKQAPCTKAKCPPIAECVPDTDGTKCGKNTCGPNTFCCNSSCGICAPEGGGCIQQFCGPTDD